MFVMKNVIGCRVMYYNEMCVMKNVIGCHSRTEGYDNRCVENVFFVRPSTFVTQPIDI